MALSGLEHLQAALPASMQGPGRSRRTGQLQGVRVPHLPGVRDEAGRQAGRAGRVPLRERRVEGQALGRGRAADPADHPQRRRAQGRGGQRDGALPPREDLLSIPTGLLVHVPDTLAEAEIAALAKAVADYKVDYVGMTLHLDGLAVEAVSGDAGKFAAAVARVARGVHAAAGPGDRRPGARWPRAWRRRPAASPLLCAATAANWEAMAKLAKDAKAPLVVRADTVAGLAELTEKLVAAGVEDLVLDPAVRELRRLAGGADPVPPAGAEEELPAARLSDHHLPLPGRRRPGDGDAAGGTADRQVRRPRRAEPASTRPRSIRCWCCARTSSPIRRSRSRWSRASTRSTSPPPTRR